MLAISTVKFGSFFYFSRLIKEGYQSDIIQNAGLGDRIFHESSHFYNGSDLESPQRKDILGKTETFLPIAFSNLRS
jgi:hypothetical protein